MIDLKLKAKAIVAVRTRKASAKASEDSLVERLMSTLTLPIPERGKAGRDAPTMDEILTEITPLLPETKIEHKVEKTVIEQKIDAGDFEGMIDAMISAKIPEIPIEDRPKVEQITIDVSDEKLEGFVSQKEFKKALERIQDAITYHSGGAGGSKQNLANVIMVTEDTTIAQNKLLANKYNVVLIMSAGITVTLPENTGTKVIEIKQGFTGVGTYTICKESS